MSRPRLLICGFGPFPEAPANPAALAIEHLWAEGWSPPGTEAAYRILPTVWTQAANEALDALADTDADGLLLVGVAVGAEGFRVEIQARNLAAVHHPDALGLTWPSKRIDPNAPDVLPITGPAAAMKDAITALGLPVYLSDDAGDYLCNFTLFRALAEARGRPVGFVHLPPEGLDDIVRAVQAAASAFADTLSARSDRT